MSELNRTERKKIILVLLCLALVGLIVASFAALLIMTVWKDTRTAVISTTLVQDVFLFILPPLAAWWYATRHPLKGTALDRRPSFRALAMVCVVFAVAIPAMNYVVWLNEQMTLPQCLSWLEDWMRQSEDQAKYITQSLLCNSSLGQMLLMVVVVGVLTGFSEEMFFRAGLLRPYLTPWRSHHVAIWVVAIIFSAVHMQFFGFVPRMLLGAWFGYLLWWTGSLWVPILAHALNNSLVVVFEYLNQKNIIDSNWLETVGVPVDGEFPLFAVASAALTAVLVFLTYKLLKKTEM